MALVTVPTFEWLAIPNLYGNNPGTYGSSTSAAIDAAGEKGAWIFQVPKTGTIKKIRFTVGTVTDSQTLRCTLQTVSATDGFPTGSTYGSSSTETIASPASNTIYTVTFATGATATKGDIVAFVVEFDSAVGNVQFGRIGAGAAAIPHQPYYAQYTSSWADVVAATFMLSVLYDDDSTELIGCWPAMSTTPTAVFSSSSTPDEYGLRFKMPFGARAIGIKAYINAISGRDCKLVLYNDAGTELASVTPDNDQAGQTSVFPIVRFSSAVTLTRDSWYRLCYQPTTTNSPTIPHLVFTDANELGQLFGANAYHCERTDAGAFTDVTNKYTPISLMLDQIDLQYTGDFFSPMG